MLATIRLVSEFTDSIRTWTTFPVGNVSARDPTVVSLQDPENNKRTNIMMTNRHLPDLSQRDIRLQIIVEFYLQTLLRRLEDNSVGY